MVFSCKIRDGYLYRTHDRFHVEPFLIRNEPCDTRLLFWFPMGVSVAQREPNPDLHQVRGRGAILANVITFILFKVTEGETIISVLHFDHRKPTTAPNIHVGLARFALKQELAPFVITYIGVFERIEPPTPHRPCCFRLKTISHDYTPQTPYSVL